MKSFFQTSFRNELTEVRSYSTVENLVKALDKLHFTEAKGHRYFVLGTLGEDGKPNGRVTAVFPVSNFHGGGYVGLYSQHGFLTLG